MQRLSRFQEIENLNKLLISGESFGIGCALS